MGNTGNTRQAAAKHHRRRGSEVLLSEEKDCDWSHRGEKREGPPRQGQRQNNQPHQSQTNKSPPPLVEPRHYAPQNHGVLRYNPPRLPLPSSANRTLESSFARVEEEGWENIKEMLGCICGMVERTQGAISSLQEQHGEEVDTRGLEALIAKVQANANIAIRQVRETALEDIRRAEVEPK